MGDRQRQLNGLGLVKFQGRVLNFSTACDISNSDGGRGLELNFEKNVLIFPQCLGDRQRQLSGLGLVKFEGRVLNFSTACEISNGDGGRGLELNFEENVLIFPQCLGDGRSTAAAERPGACKV